MAKKDELTIDRAEAQLAKRALQSLLSDLDNLKFRAHSSDDLAAIVEMQKKARTGITALRDADFSKYENPLRDFE